LTSWFTGRISKKVYRISKKVYREIQRTQNIKKKKKTKQTKKP
jgi:hypothetical protein